MESHEPAGALDPVIIGPEGLATLALSLAVMVASGGLSLLAALGQVAWQGWAAPMNPTGSTLAAGSKTRILVLGRRLPRHGQPGAEFRARLARAAALRAALPGAEIILLGGARAANRPREAEVGRAWLIARGVPAAAIRTEDRSRHTLENLRFYRAAFPAPAGPVFLVTSRYHVARSRRMAAGLGLVCQVCAAEAPRPAALRPLRALHEAFLLHWYVVGSRFADLSDNRRMLARIRWPEEAPCPSSLLRREQAAPFGLTRDVSGLLPAAGVTPAMECSPAPGRSGRSGDARRSGCSGRSGP